MVATSKVTVRVELDDIINGVQRSCGRCPVALAVLRATGAGTVTVCAPSSGPGAFRLGICIYSNSLSGYLHMDEATQERVDQFVQHFDTYGPVGSKPFEFTAEMPAPLNLTPLFSSLPQ